MKKIKEMKEETIKKNLKFLKVSHRKKNKLSEKVRKLDKVRIILQS